MRYRKEFAGVTVVRDRHGKLRYRLRRTIKGRRIDAYLPGVIGSTEFRAAYEAAIAGARIAAPKAPPGTFNHLIVTYLESPAFGSLAPSTRESKLRRLNWIRQAIGAGRYANLRPDQVETLMAKKTGPTSANRLRKDLAELFDYAARRLGFGGPNSAKLADSIKVRSTRLPHLDRRGDCSLPRRASEWNETAVGARNYLRDWGSARRRCGAHTLEPKGRANSLPPKENGHSCRTPDHVGTGTGT